MRLNVYSLRDGRRMAGLPFSDLSWSQSWNAAGSMSVTVPVSDGLAGLDLDGLIVEQQVALALLDGDTVIHAGPVLTPPDWDPSSRELSVSCGGGWSMFDWRLVLDSLLQDRVIDSELLIDEDNPGSEWTVAYQGTPGDIVRSLIQLTKRWGDLPVDVSEFDGSQSTTVQWDGWEFPVMGSVFSELLDTENGGQLRFDPYITVDGRLRWRERWSLTGVTDREHAFQWNDGMPDQRAKFTGLSSGDEFWADEVWMSGGRSDDVLIMTRQRDDDALGTTGLLWQYGNTNTADSMAGLHSAARARLNVSRRDRSWGFQVGRELLPRVGDRVEFRVNDPYLHAWKADGTRIGTVVPLIVTDVSGDASSEWLDVSCRQCGDVVNGVRSSVMNPLDLMTRRLKRVESDTRRANSATRSQTYQVVRKLSDIRGGSRGLAV